MADSWLDVFADSLGAAGVGDVPRLSEEHQVALLELARDVAHRTDRRNAPLASFLIGAYVGGRVAKGATAHDALEDAMGVAHQLLGSADEAGGRG